MSFRYVSVFSGAGGLDIGLERAGLRAASLCEIERVFCETLEANKGWRHEDNHEYHVDSRILNADIREVSGSDLFSEGELDLVVGGPPCQAFSSSGKQLSVLDPRGALVSEYYRIIDELRPKMFLFENVRGLVTARDAQGRPGGVITELIRILEDLGYSVRSALLNSADFGSSQRRVRCFLLGSREGTAPLFPAPTHSKDGGLLTLPWNSLASLLKVYAEADETQFVFPTRVLAKQFESIPNGSGLKSPGKAEATRPNGHWGYRQGTFISDLELPARTVTGSQSQDWVRWGGALRRLTFSEIRQLQGFPRDWTFKGTKAQVYKQVGNAVPSVFGEVLGEVIVKHLMANNGGPTQKIPMPHSFQSYIDYTVKDHNRNAASRQIHKRFAPAE
ncbi:MAG: DNA cytosine methyltransferase [Spirochaetales bacterium]